MDIKITPEGIRPGSDAGSFEAEPSFTVDYSSKDTLLVEGSGLLAQMVIKLLFTRRGTVLSDPSEGTMLPVIAGSGNNVATEISSTIIEDAIGSVERHIKAKQAAGTNFKSEEILESITLKSIQATQSSVEAKIEIRNTVGQVALLKVGV